MRYIGFVILYIFLLYNPSYAFNEVSLSKEGLKTCITSNGTPNHEIGKFPNKGNPHSFKAQKLKYCFPTNPVKNTFVNNKAKTVGITLTGIPIRPGTADWYDASSPRKHSRDKSSGWNLEAITPNGYVFGIDQNNAHVDNNGLYHYHGMPDKLHNFNGNSLVGYAADGHEIHYLGLKRTSSWVIKNGQRKSEPFGDYDGSYLQDYIFKEGSGSLDKCNGGKLNGKFVYFATDKFPFYPRCHWGNVSGDFTRRGG